MDRRAVLALVMLVMLVALACLPTGGTPTTTPAAETPSPSATPLPSIPMPSPSVCVPQADYVADVSIPDGTLFDPGEDFAKTWRVRVTEDCGGPFAAQVVYDGGADLKSPPTVPVTMPAQGGEVDVSVSLVAPAEPGTYKAYWRFRTLEGLLFGPRLYVEIVVPEPITPTPPSSGLAIAIAGGREDAWLLTLEGDPYPSPITDPMSLPALPEKGGPGVQVMGDTLYYLSGNGIWSASLGGETHQIYIPTGLTGEIEGFALSSDRRWLGLAMVDFAVGGVGPFIVVVPLPDGSPIVVEQPGADTDRAYMPLAWTPDGKLLYAHTPWGIGGYILFGGFLDIYRWEPGLNRPVFAPSEEYSFCVLALSSDQTLVAHRCNPPQPQNPQMKIYNLRTDTEVSIVGVADQNQMGAAHFSPSSQRLAYSVARGDPDNEAGSVVIVPSDGSISPNVIYHTEGGYAAAQGWVDEEWLLVERFTGTGSDLLLMKRDGGSIRLLASDATFLGVLWPAE